MPFKKCDMLTNIVEIIHSNTKDNAIKNISNIKITNKKTMGNKHANKIYNLYTK
jgi:hypothetical protein